MLDSRVFIELNTLCKYKWSINKPMETELDFIVGSKISQGRNILQFHIHTYDIMPNIRLSFLYQKYI